MCFANFIVTKDLLTEPAHHDQIIDSGQGRFPLVAQSDEPGARNPSGAIFRLISSGQ
jgi:hypothetical protein